jgi:hypothetical protein
MAKTLSEMTAKGKRAFGVKLPKMKANYDAAKPGMKSEYGKLPFGSITKSTYNAGVDAAEYRTPDVDKWGRKWEAGVSR